MCFTKIILIVHLLLCVLESRDYILLEIYFQNYI